jgi:ABC-type transporter Mla MlaB component
MIMNQQTINLGKSLDIVQASDLKKKLMRAVNHQQSIQLNANNVKRADTAGIQLIYAFMQYAEEKKVHISWVNPSQYLLELNRQLGTYSALKF